MTPHRLNHSATCPGPAGAFTVLEMLVSVTLLTVIIFSLYAMFNRTQQAFRGGVAQVDVMESGRAAMELLTRELEQAAVSDSSGVVNVSLTNLVNPWQVFPLTDGTARDNQRQEIFFLSRRQAEWHGTAYFVDATVIDTLSGPVTNLILLNAGVGTLYRWSGSERVKRLSNNVLFNRFNTAAGSVANLERVADGVVHLRFRIFDPQGREFTTNEFHFRDEELPAYLEVELGVLEPQIFEQARGMPTPAAAQAFLTSHAGRVQLFHQRVPLRAAPR